MATRRRADEDDEMIATANDDDDEQVTEAPEVRYMRRPSRPIDDEDERAADQTIPDRVMRIPLPQPWKHLRIWGWFDYPKEIAERMNTPEGETADETQERVYNVLREVVVRHDNWKDRDGNIYPQPGSRAFWDQIPNALAAAIIKSFFQMVRANPTPQVARKSKSRR